MVVIVEVLFFERNVEAFVCECEVRICGMRERLCAFASLWSGRILSQCVCMHFSLVLAPAHWFSMCLIDLVFSPPSFFSLSCLFLSPPPPPTSVHRAHARPPL